MSAHGARREAELVGEVAGGALALLREQAQDGVARALHGLPTASTVAGVPVRSLRVHRACDLAARPGHTSLSIPRG